MSFFEEMSAKADLGSVNGQAAQKAASGVGDGIFRGINAANGFKQGFGEAWGKGSTSISAKAVKTRAKEGALAGAAYSIIKDGFDPTSPLTPDGMVEVGMGAAAGALGYVALRYGKRLSRSIYAGKDAGKKGWAEATTIMGKGSPFEQMFKDMDGAVT